MLCIAVQASQIPSPLIRKREVFVLAEEALRCSPLRHLLSRLLNVKVMFRMLGLLRGSEWGGGGGGGGGGG